MITPSRFDDIAVLNPTAINSVPADESSSEDVDAPIIKGHLRRDGEAVSGKIKGSISREQGGSEWIDESIPSEFNIPIPANATSVLFHFMDSFAAGTQDYEMEGPFKGIRDLGVIELGPAREIPFSVHDVTGTPIGGAIAVRDWQDDPICERTDARGNGTLVVDDQIQRIAIGKAGYRTVQLHKPFDQPSVAIVLEPDRGLVVGVTRPDGAPVYSGTYLVVTADEEAFEEVRGSTSIRQLTGGSAEHWLGCRMGIAGTREGFEPNADGKFVVAGLLPNVGVKVTLWSSLHERLGERSLIPEASATLITFQLPTMPHPFVGVVRGQDGTPVAQAEICAGPQRARFVSDEEGRFQIPCVFTETIGVWISQDGFENFEDSKVTIPTDGSTRDFVLTATR
jgi:Carboxypeptidase regulatory-like domain